MAKFAIIEYGSKQYNVSVNDEVFLDKIDANDGDSVVFDKVLMIDGNIGTPYLSNSTVLGQIVKQGKSEKLHIIHHISQKHHTKRAGHRQPYTRVKIVDIKG